MKKLLLGTIASLLLSESVFAAHHTPLAPQPSTCITSAFSSTGNEWWKSIVLKLTNNCGTTVDFQNAAVTFQNGISLNTNFWGDFAPLSYPDNMLTITSQKLSDTKYQSTFSLHFPNIPGANSKLPVGSSIYIKYGAATEAHIDGTTMVFVDTPALPSNVEFTNTTAKPVDVTQNYALVHLTMNGQRITDVQVPWNSTQTISGISAGTYSVSADNIPGTSSMYQANVTPTSFQLVSGQTAKVSVNYVKVQQAGKLAIQVQALPTQLSGYTGKPTVSVTEVGTGSSVSAATNWNTTTTVSSLKAGSSYQFSTPVINFNGANCTPTFNPSTLVASDTQTPITALTYQCTQVVESIVTVKVNGAPTTLSSLKTTFTPNNGSTPMSQVVTLTNGSGTSTLKLTTGVVYSVTADSVPGYSITFNPQPLTASANVTETITLSPQTGGTPVGINGRLKVCGTQLCNEHGQPIQLRGMSSHGLQWYGWGKCLKAGSLDALARDFNASVIRLSLYVQEGGYETDPVGFTNQMNTLIDEASKRGIYVIVDWHQLTPGDPNYNLTRAQKFFTDIATANKNRNNLLYEIANEPNGVSWSAIKSYAEKIIPIIRAIDPNTVILVGTHGWGSLGVSDGRSSQDIINAPVNATNIMYTFHFYAASHKDAYLNELNKASSVLPIFVTEWGTQTSSGDGTNDFVMSQRYIDLMATKKIGWTNWNYSDDFRSGAVWKTGTCSAGTWVDSSLKPAGVWVKSKIKG